jgi:hypothetical protein
MYALDLSSDYTDLKNLLASCVYPLIFLIVELILLHEKLVYLLLVGYGKDLQSKYANQNQGSYHCGGNMD